MAGSGNNGIIAVASNYSVEVTLARLQNLVREKGATVFAVVDHSGEAERVGMTMRPTKVLIFGSPRAGTPVMLHSPSAALDLPLKVLIAEDKQGKVWISYNSPQYLQQRHQLPDALLPNISVVEMLAAKAGE
jgi:uncharacterized protein (DUF302 family)